MATADLLVEANAALHKLLTGTAVVEFHDQNGEVMKYNLASITRLQAYVLSLSDELDRSKRINGPMRVFF